MSTERTVVDPELAAALSAAAELDEPLRKWTVEVGSFPVEYDIEAPDAEAAVEIARDFLREDVAGLPLTASEVAS